MSSCLGLYIETNLIKYAKVNKDHNITKVEAFGVKFYDKLGDAIKQIVEETYSFKIPISVNLSNEAYNYYYMFSLLNKKDMGRAIQTEFESYCFDKGINDKSFETRYALVNSIEDKEKIKVIFVSENKAELTTRLQDLNEYKVSTISPLPLALPNLVNFVPKQNIAIVNIEENTTITTIIDEKIYQIDQIEEGSKEILRQINVKENSFSKAYEICKNTTIYTMDAKDLQTEENLYLEDIMPTLYKIVTKVKSTLENNMNKIDKVYITGTLSVINNIDLYFQEYITESKCEILKPFFIDEISTSINIKDYIEVNSAIALGLQGLGEGLKNMNFKKPSFTDQLPDWLKLEVGGSGKNLKKKNSVLGKLNIHFDLNEKLDKIEIGMIRFAVGLLAIIILYGAFSMFLNREYDKKEAEIAEGTKQADGQIALVSADITKVNTITNDYTKARQSLEEISEKLTEQSRYKDAIPLLLQRIMYAIPVDAQITSIENTTGRKIVIQAQSEKYEKLAFFVANLKVNDVLLNVVSTAGTMEGNLVKTTIEGELP